MNPNEEKRQLNQAQAYLTKDNFEEAAKIYDSLIEKNQNAEAMYMRASFGLEGEGDWLSNRRIPLLESSAALGHSGAMYQLSIHLEEGENIAQDVTRATKLLESAAELGHPNATWRVGIMLLYRESATPQEVTKGLLLIERAAHLKSQGALRTLAEFYTKGEFCYSIDIGRADELSRLADSDDVFWI